MEKGASKRVNANGNRRYRFIRSDNKFDGLRDYFLAPYFRVNSKDLVFPVITQQKMDLFESEEQELEISDKDPKYSGKLEKKSKGEGMRVMQGNLFERIAQKIYGGKKFPVYLGEINAGDQEYVPNGQGILLKTDHLKTKGKDFFLTPDLIIDSRKLEKILAKEVKSVGIGKHLKLEDYQIAKYAALQLKNPFDKDLEISFEIFRYNINDLPGRYPEISFNELKNGLLSSTRYSLSIPFSVMFEMYSKKSQFCKRDGWDEQINAGSPIMHSFLAEPKETIESLGLKPERFEVIKRRMPRTFNQGIAITPFPMVVIKDKEYDSFVGELPGVIDSNVEISNSFFRHTKGLLGKEPDFKEPEGVFGENLEPVKEAPF